MWIKSTYQSCPLIATGQTLGSAFLAMAFTRSMTTVEITLPAARPEMAVTAPG